MAEPLNDERIRRALHATVLAPHHEGEAAVVVDEAAVYGNVLDVLVVARELHGYEIKSDRDTLRRLQQQAACYGAHLHRMTLVVGERHRDKAIAIIPDWWGVLTARELEGSVVFEATREAGDNPQGDRLRLDRFLWRPEAWAAVQALGLARGKSAWSGAKLSKFLHETLEPAALRAVVVEAMRGRGSWRNATTDRMRSLVGRQGSPP